MKRVLLIPQETKDLQSVASNPRNSVWVSANAGSGKTHVLSTRVIRLLLDGTDPSKILCLTYTRAAAATMSNRVFGNLAAWAVLDDEALARAIGELDGATPDDRRLRRARQLFAQALETPGGLKIQTIHAFCEAVLHQFPLEANIAGHFEMLDSQMEAALFAEARREMITGTMGTDNPALSEAFATVLERGGEFGLDGLLNEIVRRRDGLRAFIGQIADEAWPCGDLFAEFGFVAGETAQTVTQAAWPLPGFSVSEFSTFVRAAEDVDARKALNDIIPHAQAGFVEADPERRLALLAKGFLKTDGAPYDPASAFKKALHARLPDLADRYTAAAAAIIAASDRLALFRMLEGTRAALTIADWMIARYEQMKSGRGFLDFNDLITRTVRLLARPDAGPWVQYKLDRGIDHILLDEAQDTSPDQWAVVKRLAEEFFTGFGSRDDIHRTIFAVGDEKQSIYSFQGADPAAFSESSRDFSGKVTAANRTFVPVQLTWSFRSTDDVLSAVDTVFASEAFRKGLTLDGMPLVHKAIRAGAPGYVEVWPSVGASAVEEPDDWTVPVDHAQAPAIQVAEQVASAIRKWIDSGEIIEGSGKRLTAGDVLVLVRKRDRFVHALSRSLKGRQVSVAGADRLSLPGHIAVKDMIALGHFLLQPEDDLSLAAVLRSPIFGLSEDALFGLASGRGKRLSLLDSLRNQVNANSDFKAIVHQLSVWQDQVAFSTVFDFYAAILGRDGLRSRMIGRLGQEAGDILDEFLSFCLAQEKTGLPGLESFLATLENAGPEIKREMDQTRDEVRIMTVHAAKGLEAPVVFLVDSGSAPFSDQHLPRLIAFEPQNGLWRGNGFLWRSAGDVANQFSQSVTARLKERAEEEYRRLLYVGMTRAEDRLIVCGYHGKRPPSAATWHSMVSTTLAASPYSQPRAHPAGGDDVHRFRVTGSASTAQTTPEPDAPRQSAQPAPAWLTQRLALVEQLPRPLSPSGASILIDASSEPALSLKSPVLDAEGGAGFAIQRGLVMHRLLQMLPSVADADREGAAQRYVARTGAGWSSEDSDRAVAQIMAILRDDAFAPIFAKGSRAEVAVIGTLVVKGAERAISGKIDRLAVTDSDVLIVDYKTNRPAPQSLEQVPQGYVIQLALYRSLLQPLYPNHMVSAGLLFTDAPRLIRLPATAMDAALVRLTQA